MPNADAERDDIQALVRAGYADLTEAVFLLARVKDPAAAKAWIGAAPVVSAADLKKGRLNEALQIALTAPGLRALGLSEAVMAGFSPEFLSGMAGLEARSRRLGDIGDSAPARWDWGYEAREPHVAVLLYAAPGRLAGWRSTVTTAAFQGGFEVLAELGDSDMQGHEPFGFLDGVSQPEIDWEGRRRPNTAADLEYGALIAAGEVLLGHANEYGLYTDRPVIDPLEDPQGLLAPAEDDPARRDFGRNGTYLVFRQLDQDVRGFWRFLASQQDAAGALTLAEKLVGRRMDGGSLLPIQDEPMRGVGKSPEDIRRNRFTFDDDPDGRICPVGAHIRRANPRTADMPGGPQGPLTQIVRMLGLVNDPPAADVIASTRFHRILRRGREFGRVLSPDDAMKPDAPDPESGLHFICLNANIARQFEFLQSSWIISTKFGGLDDEQDPLLGSRAGVPEGATADEFSLPQAVGAGRRLTGLPRFVTVRGGAYFFLPSLRALRFIAA
jgi:deferrochelatase/peroxidase EfeB